MERAFAAPACRFGPGCWRPGCIFDHGKDGQARASFIRTLSDHWTAQVARPSYADSEPCESLDAAGLGGPSARGAGRGGQALGALTAPPPAAPEVARPSYADSEPCEDVVGRTGLAAHGAVTADSCVGTLAGSPIAEVHHAADPSTTGSDGEPPRPHSLETSGWCLVDGTWGRVPRSRRPPKKTRDRDLRNRLGSGPATEAAGLGGPSARGAGRGGQALCALTAPSPAASEVAILSHVGSQPCEEIAGTRAGLAAHCAVRAASCAETLPCAADPAPEAAADGALESDDTSSDCLADCQDEIRWDTTSDMEEELDRARRAVTLKRLRGCRGGRRHRQERARFQATRAGLLARCAGSAEGSTTSAAPGCLHGLASRIQAWWRGWIALGALQHYHRVQRIPAHRRRLHVARAVVRVRRYVETVPAVYDLFVRLLSSLEDRTLDVARARPARTG